MRVCVTVGICYKGLMFCLSMLLLFVLLDIEREINKPKLLQSFLTMSDYFPEEVVANILIRLRVKDLVSCRRVSKQWLSIIDDPHYISRQLERSISTNSNAALFLQHRDSPTLYWKQNYSSDVSFFSTLIHYEPNQVLLMGSCHGLVCFSLFNHPGDFVVLNPSTGEQHMVSSPIKVESEGETTLKAYGFGYDESSDDYKMVRIIQTMDDSYRCSYRAEINGVRSKDFFRTIPLPTADWGNSSRKSIGVFVGGSIHWCTLHFADYYLLGHVIDAIDLVSNTYHQLQFPDYIFGETVFENLNVGIVDTRLSLCGVHEDQRKIGIWVMEEYGNPESWNRLYSIDYESFFRSVTSVGSNGDKFLLMIDCQKLAWCDPTKNEDGAILINDTKWRYGRYEAVYCLESLVKIFPDQAAEARKDAYKKQLKRLADQEITEDEHPAFLNLCNLKALMYEGYIQPYTWDDDDYVLACYMEDARDTDYDFYDSDF